MSTIWLIHYKASMSERSGSNFDGSTFCYALLAVPANSLSDALIKLEDFNAEDNMETLDIWKCERVGDLEYTFAETSDEVEMAIEQATRTGKPFGAIVGSESMDDDGADYV